MHKNHRTDATDGRHRWSALASNNQVLPGARAARRDEKETGSDRTPSHVRTAASGFLNRLRKFDSCRGIIIIIRTCRIASSGARV
jgi:hypothetical protein